MNVEPIPVWPPLGLLMVLLVAWVFLGCSPKPEEPVRPSPSPPLGEANHSHEGDEAHEDHGHHHAHSAPHGGTLVAIGDHFAHVELVVDSTAGKITAYVLDAEAEKAERIKQDPLEILILKHGATASTPETADSIKLSAVADPLTGESVGDTSEFSAVSDALEGRTEFEGVLKSITIKGEVKKDIQFKFPEGNE